MFFASALLLFQQVTNVYQQPSYFVPIFMALWVLGLVLCLGLTVLGFTNMKKVSKEMVWFGLAGVFLLIYFLQWFGFIFAIGKQNMTLTWGIASFMHLPIVIAVLCVIAGITKLKSVNREIIVEEV